MNRLLPIIIVSILGLPFQINAQTPGDRVVTIVDAPIYAVMGAVRPVRVAATGTVMELVSTNGTWVRVRYVDPNVGSQLGYVQAQVVRLEPANLRPVNLSVPELVQTQEAAERTPQQPTTTTAPPTRTPLARNGFWFNAGFGYGSLGCDTCFGERADGGSGGISMGGTLNDKWLLGGGTTGWYRSEDGIWVSASTIDFRFRFYPSVYSGFFLNAGLGLGSVSIGSGRTAISETGVGAMLGLGWDLRVGRNVSVTPFWNGSGISTETANVNFGQIGVGITVH